MRPRLSLGLLQLGLLVALASGAHAQSNVPGAWSTDPQCSARALRVTFGRNMLTMERNGHLIYRGSAHVAVSDDAITVRLAHGNAGPERTDTERPDHDRNVIRFSRGGDAIRMVAAPRGGAAQYPRVPPLYPCAAGGAAAGNAPLSPAATLPPAGQQREATP